MLSIACTLAATQKKGGESRKSLDVAWTTIGLEGYREFVEAEDRRE